MRRKAAKFSPKSSCTHDVPGGDLIRTKVMHLPSAASYPENYRPMDILIFWYRGKPPGKKITNHKSAWKSKPQTTVRLPVCRNHVKIISLKKKKIVGEKLATLLRIFTA